MIYDLSMRLRAPERSVLQRFVEWLNDPDVIEGLVIYAPLSLVVEEDWFENLRIKNNLCLNYRK